MIFNTNRENFKVEGLPEIYSTEINEKLRHTFHKTKPYDYNFVTNDNKYKCSYG